MSNWTKIVCYQGWYWVLRNQIAFDPQQEKGEKMAKRWGANVQKGKPSLYNGMAWSRMQLDYGTSNLLQKKYLKSVVS